MPRLFLLLLSISMATLAGIGVIVALVMGYYHWQPIALSAAIGALISLPVSWMAARRIQDMDPLDSPE